MTKTDDEYKEDDELLSYCVNQRCRGHDFLRCPTFNFDHTTREMIP